ncbi:hypothetical protein ATI61_107328 [Archangium gephyra]|uniref:Uncharacterized protein n=1 Tax=Archangium gephyra TaxID=48 RepID=A0AAC8QIC2_9BACT|nr:hypothetical protein [Archangium gephyra]AKJ07884.1 Hypothetical protein AA314_09510 [Archangium gephyra]REG29632.1 hypothetical protein ATI61_107328 [Archangium gephyra]
MSQQGVRLSSCLAFVFVALGLSMPASAASVTYSSPMVNGYYVGTLHPTTGSSAADTARRFCQDRNHAGAQSYATSIRSTAYSFINGTGGVGPWSTTGNANVTMLDSITCGDVSTTSYPNPMVNGYYVGTLYPTTGSSAADTARRFCQDRNHAGAQSYSTSVRSTAYSFINGTGGVGPWSTTGNANVTMLDSITCSGTRVTFSGPMVNGYYVGTYYPTTGSSAADTARRFCQDNGYASSQGYTTSLRSTAYSFINGTGGVGPWSTTGNANVTMLDTITCASP